MQEKKNDMLLCMMHHYPIESTCDWSNGYFILNNMQAIGGNFLSLNFNK